MANKPYEFDNFPESLTNHLEFREALWRWQAVLKEHTDGDTAKFLIDRGYREYAYQAMRFVGFDTWERFRGSPETRQYGLEATEYTRKMFPVDTPMALVTYKEAESFSRWVATAYVEFKPHHVDILRSLDYSPDYFVNPEDIPLYESYVGRVLDISVFYIGSQHEKVIQ